MTLAGTKQGIKLRALPLINAAEVKRLAETMGPAAIARELKIARSSVYRMLEG